MKTRMVMLSLLLSAAAVQAQSAYRWTDRQGQVHYSDQPPPPGETQVIERRPLQANSVQTSTLPYATQRAARDFPVTLYTAPECKDECDRGRALLARRGVPYAEKVLTTKQDAEAFRKLFQSEAFLPSASVGSRNLRGFVDTEWNGALDNAGYPRAIAPHTRVPQAGGQPASATGAK